MDDAGNTDTKFYQTNMQPANWYKWFAPNSPESESDEGWTEVSSSFTLKHSYYSVCIPTPYSFPLTSFLGDH